MTANCLMQIKSTAVEHSAVLLTCIKIPHGFQAFVLSTFEWLIKTDFTVNACELILTVLIVHFETFILFFQSLLGPNGL